MQTRVEGALKFGCYEVLKPWCMQLSSSRTLNYLMASVVAGAVASIVLCPAEEVRIKQVSDPAFCEEERSEHFESSLAKKAC